MLYRSEDKGDNKIIRFNAFPKEKVYICCVILCIVVGTMYVCILFNNCKLVFDDYLTLYPETGANMTLQNVIVDENGVYNPLSDDPGILFDINGRYDIHSIRVTLDVPLNQDIPVTLYYALEDRTLNEQQVYRKVIGKHTSDVFFNIDIPGCTMIRFDIDGNVDLHSVQISSNRPVLAVKIDKWLVVVPLLLFIIIFCYLFLSIRTEMHINQIVNQDCIEQQNVRHIYCEWFLLVALISLFLFWFLGNTGRMRYISEIGQKIRFFRMNMPN